MGDSQKVNNTEVTEHDVSITLQSVKMLTVAEYNMICYPPLQSVHLELLHVLVPWCWGRETRNWGWIP